MSILIPHASPYIPSGSVNGLLTGLVSYWALDDDLTDEHGSNDLSESASPVAFATGILNNGQTTDPGNPKYGYIADNASLSMGDVDMSMSLWLKKTSAAWDGAWQNMMGKWGGTNEYAIYYSPNTYTPANRLLFLVRNTADDTTTEVYVDLAISTDTWYHVVVWHDSTANEIGMTINDGTPATQSTSGGIRDGSEQFKIGDSWIGVLDEAAIWKNVVLSAEQITALYNSGSGLAYGSFD